MKMEVTIEISTEMVEDILIMANCHVGYWCQITNESEDEPDALSSYSKLFDNNDGWIEYGIVDCMDGVLTDERRVLTYDALKSGVKVMSEKYPKHFSDFMNENSDVITADVFLQCCLLGDIVYG